MVRFKYHGGKFVCNMVLTFDGSEEIGAYIREAAKKLFSLVALRKNYLSKYFFFPNLK